MVWDSGVVAGGMRSRRDDIPTAMRVALGHLSGDPCPGKHCWVIGGGGGDQGEKRPGLLVEWRQAGADRWEGRVVYLSLSATGRWVLTEEWLPASQLVPA